MGIIPRGNQFDAERQKISVALQSTYASARSFVNLKGLYYRDGFEGLKPEELYELGKELLGVTVLSEAYEKLTRTPSDGQLTYYDRLIGIPELMPAYQALDLTVRGEEKVKSEKAIDIATGTGFAAKILMQRAHHVYAVDTVAAFLTVAERELAGIANHFNSSFECLKMDPMDLVAPKGFLCDFASSCGLTNFLSYQEKTQFYSGLNKLLRKNGRYYEPQLTARTVKLYGGSPRGNMAGCIASFQTLLNEKRLNFNKPSGAVNYGELGFHSELFPFSRAGEKLFVLKLTKL